MIKESSTTLKEKENKIVEISVVEDEVAPRERANSKKPPTDYIDSFHKKSMTNGSFQNQL